MDLNFISGRIKQEHKTVPRQDLELNVETNLHSLVLTPYSVAVKKGSSKFEPIKYPKVDPLQVLITTCSDWTHFRRKVAWRIRFTQFN